MALNDTVFPVVTFELDASPGHVRLDASAFGSLDYPHQLWGRNFRQSFWRDLG
jgi:hypothetical protein